MKTWIETFTFDYFDGIDEKMNRYFKTFRCSPLSVSMTINCGKIFVAVVVKDSEDTNDGT